MDCNILLLGQTGVGKSSLLNYLAGAVLAKAGVSFGVGGLTKGIHKYPLVINGQKCVVSDSEGFELSNLAFWKKLIKKELSIRDNEGIGDWYHIIVFCIGANGARVQDFELSLLKEMLNSGYGVVVALTKSDLATEEDLDSMKKVLWTSLKKSSQISIVEVSSKRMRSSRPFGKKELSDAIYRSWCKSLVSRLPAYVYDPIFVSLGDWRRLVLEWIAGLNIGYFGESKEDAYQKLKQKVKGKQRALSERLQNRMLSSLKDTTSVFNGLDVLLNLSSNKIGPFHSIERIEMPRISSVFSETSFWTELFGRSRAKRRTELERAFNSVYGELVTEYCLQYEAFATYVDNLFEKA